jgi:mono/diheme cytochrome c family protein
MLAVVCVVSAALWLSGCAQPAAPPKPTTTTQPAAPATPGGETSAKADPAKTPATTGAEAAKPTTPAEPASPVAAAKVDVEAGKKLFDANCAGCHGDTGDGNGLAARVLYPKPRNFREAKFRLVTTTNRIPSDEDLLNTITRGMPGSAMFPFGHLPEADRKTLVGYVRHLMRRGVEDRLRRAAADAGDTVDAAELARDVDRVTLAGPKLTLPADFPKEGAESVARGKALYLKNCATCHGQTAKGDGVQDQRDDDGTPTSPRDYTRGIFKGGREREQLYARTLLGMPGSPMPQSNELKPAQIGDMVHFIQSLSDPSAQAKVEHKRAGLVAKKRSSPLPKDIPDAVWESAAAVPVVVSPLWWRNYDEPGLQVQAVHDGQSVAVRLTWADASKNDQAVRPQEFDDKVAVQLFRGSPEPFLGMGSTAGAVDMWLWTAEWQGDQTRYADVDTTYPNIAVDDYPLEKKPEGTKGHPTVNQDKTYLTGWAAGNLRSDPTRGVAASNLQAKGFGTLTLLPKVSQIVNGKGEWSNGHWTVVLRRSLDVKAEEGIKLAAGDKLSIAFALWDGTARDRDGQKLVSIWHDVELQK